MNDWVDVLTLVTALGCGLIAGVWFAFSSFVMAGLARLPAPQGLAAMQAINRTAETPVFLTVLLGATLLSLVVAVWAVFDLSDARGPWALAGGILGVVGTMGVTAVGNVPLNNALAPLDPADPGAQRQWTRYLRVWTSWNHVRGVVALAATALLILALVQD